MEDDRNQNFMEGVGSDQRPVEVDDQGNVEIDEEMNAQSPPPETRRIGGVGSPAPPLMRVLRRKPVQKQDCPRTHLE